MTNQHRASINLNDDVKVKLTDYGRDLLAKKRLTRQPDEAGYIKFQLWELMNIFGSYVCNGCSIPCNGCSIPFTFNRILIAPFDSAMTDQHQHRAKPEQWAKVKGYAPGLEVCSCLIELRDRIEALEATQHAHAITGPTNQLHSYKVGPAEPVEDWGKGHTQVRQHRATPEQWAFTESRGVGDPVYATCSCLIELRDRIQLLEATQHAHIEAKAAGAQVGRSSAAVDRVRDLQDQILDGTLTLAKALKEINGKPIERTRQTTYLVEKIRVRMIQEQKNSNSWQALAEAVLREVAEWLRSEYPLLTLGTAAWANLLDNEANR